MDLKDIKAIIDLMKKNSISEFELEKQEFKIRLKRGNLNGPAAYDDAPGVPQYATAAPVAALPAPAAAPVSPTAGDAEIKSPMIGTLYRSPSPEAAPYVDIGSEVGPDTVVCIIEAMKVMNEIKAETRGIITAVVAENSKPVEFGQALFKIRPL
ncbi:MAG: acetyl-CoA carboxylase biotin carboxyl carrier protein [Limisphaerales bacterium]|nr:MAG: acetyl-CoA carboxylase biotin carboxyl carrier protein [Limisphaerales bacterium]KAG0506714.1 MAG: acetyl-CoA carboxylase biotin carboxyl carrier protein [Limisphaerales bacterium]TXT45196.1 MAG: acetyl-CoA carboxylase biotin carboxyl carrier protein [Limisphaerales bacterium]